MLDTTARTKRDNNNQRINQTLQKAHEINLSKLDKYGSKIQDVIRK